MKTLELVFFDAGGGHRSAANALREIAARQQRPWLVELMNLQELLDEMDIFRKITGIRLQDIYNLMLRRGWTFGSPALIKGMHGVIRIYHRAQVNLLAEHWRKRQPDLVVSCVPNFNRAIGDAIRRVMPAVPLVTILTDIADYPPHFWIERQEQYFICGSEKAYQQALALGHKPERVFRTSGMILHPRFYEDIDVDRAEARRALGLDPARPTGLVMFGGEGSGEMLAISRSLDRSGLDLQVIAICGRNERLQAQLRAAAPQMKIHIEGFTREVPRYMRMADFFIGKPGPGSISEALTMGLPVIVQRNSRTLPQERYNAEWIAECGVGFALRGFRGEIVGAVQQMLDPLKRLRFQENVRRLNNRAVFEIPDILEEILARAGRNHGTSPADFQFALRPER